LPHTQLQTFHLDHLDLLKKKQTDILKSITALIDIKHTGTKLYKQIKPREGAAFEWPAVVERMTKGVKTLIERNLLFVLSQKLIKNLMSFHNNNILMEPKSKQTLGGKINKRIFHIHVPAPIKQG
jgi:hypothetical protein